MNLPLGLLSPVLIIVIISIFPVWQAGLRRTEAGRRIPEFSYSLYCLRVSGEVGRYQTPNPEP